MPDRLEVMIQEIDARLPSTMHVEWHQINDRGYIYLHGKPETKPVMMFGGDVTEAIRFLEGFHFCCFVEGMWKAKE